ncbi:MAG TPA: glutaredoxin family protein [Ktedonobacterales bacterium]|nr:glutaredoxin family protein [Ktedonobacterales bacterium]
MLVISGTTQERARLTPGGRLTQRRQGTTSMPSMRIVTLYAKAGCHLCDEAREYLEEALEEAPGAERERPLTTAGGSGYAEISLDEIDIRRDPVLFEQYRYRIPVIVVDGVERLEGHVTAAEVADLLHSLRT